jgi:hypothetical protein
MLGLTQSAYLRLESRESGRTSLPLKHWVSCGSVHLLHITKSVPRPTLIQEIGMITRKEVTAALRLTSSPEYSVDIDVYFHFFIKIV